MKKLSKNCGIDQNTTNQNVQHRNQESINLFMNYEFEIVDEIIRNSKVEIKLNSYCLEDFKLIKLLGKGSFGQVYFVKNNKNLDYFAMKALKKDIVLQDPDGIECAKLERDIMTLESDQFLTKILCSFQNDDYLFFVMEFLNGGDLMFHLLKSKQFSENRTRFYSIEIACGIQFLHSRNIIYRDLKLDNVLLDNEGHCKIADFGMCKHLDNLENCKTKTFCGTPDYIAPEVSFIYAKKTFPSAFDNVCVRSLINVLLQLNMGLR